MIGDISQIGKRLRVITYLDAEEGLDKGDPFLLTGAKGSEDVSKPFRFELEMHRDPDKPFIRPSQLINTVVHFGIRQKELPYNDELTPYVYRTGIIEQASVKYLSQSVKSNVWVYNVTMVPAFQMLSRQILYRVFEKMDVKQILREALGGYPELRVNFHGIDSDTFPRLPYCVQFGESTFNFASRLMARFGIWYYFANGQTTVGTDAPVGNGIMVLGRSKPPSSACGYPVLKVKNVESDDQLDDDGTVARCEQSCTPAVEWIAAGGFNALKPTKPFSSSARVIAGLDVLSHESGVAPPEAQAKFKSELFGVPVWDDAQAEAFAHTRMEGAEANVWTLNGSTMNPTIVAGFTANVTGKDGHGKDVQSTNLINHVEISAYEWGYEFNVGSNFLLAVKNVLQPLGSASGRAQFASNLASQGLSNWLQNRFPYDLQNWWHPDSQQPGSQNLPIPYFDTFVTGGMIATMSGLITAFEASVEKVIASESDGYSCSFQSIYWDDGWPRRVPLPEGKKPVAYGPHLAVVVGMYGLDTTEDSDDRIWDTNADQLGRVRIRFPWQRHVTGGSEFDRDPWRSDRETCWVRVAQGWAGAKSGWQFIPRIGEEVVVEFLAGDPDQPVVTGRVYHAGGTTNLPLPPPGWESKAIDNDFMLTAYGRNDFQFSGLVTASTGRPASDPAERRYHMMRFDDTYKDEQLLLRSQGEMDITAKRSLYETTEGNRHARVVQGKDKDGNSFGGASFTTTDGEYDLHVGGDRLEAVEKGYQLRVKKDTQLDLKGDCIAVVGGNLSLNATTIVLEAKEKITLKVGGSTIVLNPTAVFHDGPFVKKQGGGPADVAADVVIKDIADATKADPGEPPNKRVHHGGGGGGGGGGGKRGEQKVPAQHADNWKVDHSGMVSIDFAGLSSGGGGSE